MHSVDIVPRHGHFHTANIKYGYLIFALSIIHVVITILSRIFWKKRKLPLWLIVTIWTIILGGVSVLNVPELNENSSVVLKRFGRMGYVLIPFSVALAIRWPLAGPSRISATTWLYMLNLPLHKWLLRLILLCASIHSIGFIYKWWVGNTLSKLFTLYNFLGVVVWTISLVLVVISIKLCRKRWYKTFYVVHNLTLWLLVLVIAIHARPGVLLFCVINATILALQIYQRLMAYPVTPQIATAPSSLQYISISKPPTFPVYLPGSHVRLTYPISNYKSWLLPTHPFTIVSSHQLSTLDLIIKKTCFEISTNMEYSLTGPFLPLPASFYNTTDQLNILCGGSGISFGIPLLAHFNTSIPIRLVWCIQNKQDLHVLKNLDTMLMSLIDVYVTGDLSDVDEAADGLLATDIELSSLNEPKSESSPRILNGRPDFSKVLIDDADVSVNKKWIVACGPVSLVNDAKTFSKDKGWHFFLEVYQM